MTRRSAAAASSAEEIFLAVGPIKNNFSTVGIKRPGHAMGFICVDAIHDSTLVGQIIGSEIPVTIEPRGMNFGRDKESRQVQ